MKTPFIQSVILVLCFQLITSKSVAQIINTVAGDSTAGYSGDGGQATSAELHFPETVAFDAMGNLYISDGNTCIRKIDTSGIITTVVGTPGTSGFSGDGGPATSSLIDEPSGIAFDATGNLYFADAGNNRIRKVNTSGIITTIAGTGAYGGSGDGGPAILATLYAPIGLTFDSYGNLFVADWGSNKIRKIDPSGIITSVIGNGIGGFSGDGGPAVSAHVQYLTYMAFDAWGNLFFGDGARIRKISTSGIVSTIAGDGVFYCNGDGGPAIYAELNFVYGIAFDPAGNLYFSEVQGHRVRKINTSGIVTTIAGTGIAGYSGDGGPATSAKIRNPRGIAFDIKGNLYITDYDNSRIRKITLACSTPSVNIVGSGNSICVGDNTTLHAYGAATYSWSPTGNISSSITVSPSVITIYTLTATTNTCTTIQTATVIVNPLPTFTLSTSSDTVCKNSAANLQVSTNATYTIQWFNQPNSGSVISTAATYISPLLNQNTTYYVLVTDSLGCKNSDSSHVIVYTPPDVNILHDSIECNNTFTPLTVNSTYSTAVSYMWSDGFTNPVHVITTPGNYWVQYIFPHGCVSKDSMSLSFIPNPILHLGNDTNICKPSYNLIVDTGYSYVWNTGAISNQINIISSGNYWVTVTNQNTCKLSDTIQVNLYAPPSINILKDSTECSNLFSPIALNANYPGTILYNWSDGFTGQTHSLTTPGIYWLDFILNNTCVARDSFDLFLYSYPIVSLGNDTTFCLGNKLLDAFNSSCTYLWSTGETSPNVIATHANTYWVQVNRHGCISSDTLVVNPEYSLFNFIMPNIVTPNNDNINDFIDFSTYQFSSFQFDIYSRWGNKIFESADPKCIWKPVCDDGSYYYVAQYRIDCGTETQNKSLKGFITVLK